MTTRLARSARRRRLELGLTKEEAARLAKVSLSTWHTVETAEDSTTFREITLVGVATALDLNVDRVFNLAGMELPDDRLDSELSLIGDGKPRASRDVMLHRIQRGSQLLDDETLALLVQLIETLGLATQGRSDPGDPA